MPGTARHGPTRTADRDLVHEPGAEDEELVAGERQVPRVQWPQVLEPRADLGGAQHGPGARGGRQDGHRLGRGVGPRGRREGRREARGGGRLWVCGVCVIGGLWVGCG